VKPAAINGQSVLVRAALVGFAFFHWIYAQFAQELNKLIGINHRPLRGEVLATRAGAAVGACRDF
jgi:hypothetical protein